MIFLLALVSALIVEAKVYLVAVGISDYPGTSHDLRLASKDASTFYDLCRKNNGATSVILTNHNATRSNILSSIRRVYSQASENDQVIFFFSGHGYRGGFVAYDGRLPYSDIRKGMSYSQSKKKMIFADACFSGKIRENKKSSRIDEDGEAQKSDVMLFLSSRSTEKSYERRTMKNGMFTTYLDLGLRGYADSNRDRIITAKELFDYVSHNVSRMSGGKQHPVMWGKFSDSMPIMQW